MLAESVKKRETLSLKSFNKPIHIPENSSKKLVTFCVTKQEKPVKAQPVSSEKVLSKDEKKTAPSKKQVSKKILTWLCITYPNLFDMESRSKPLKIGIHKDILEDLPNHFQTDSVEFKEVKKYLHCALHFYCSGVNYYKTCMDSLSRFDLAGVASREMTDSEKAGAKDNYNTLVKLIASKPKRKNGCKEDKI